SLKRARIALQIVKVRGRESIGVEVSLLVLAALAHQHQLLQVRERKRMEQERVHHAEDSGISADAEGQGEHRHGGKTRALAQHAQAVAKIVQQGLHASPQITHPLQRAQRGHPNPHSYLSATIGSTLVARRAGRKLASSAAATSTTATVAKVNGSRGLTPNSIPDSRRVAAKLAKRPAATPARTTRIPCPTTRRIRSRGLAPNAMRNPISCMRWLTE